MFESLFAKFRKPKQKQNLTLEQEFDVLKLKYARIASSELYEFLSEYYQARLEINRDAIEGLNPMIELERAKLMQLQAENKVIRDFYTDIQDMKQEAELNQIESVV